MRILNQDYRGVDRTTDVLSFPQIDDFSIHDSQFTVHEFVLGDIVISLPRAKRQAMEYGTTLNEELKRLLIHGLLHLIGYDHEDSKYAEKKMQKKASELFKKIKL
jgi:probable rRNA maturation factor